MPVGQIWKFDLEQYERDFGVKLNFCGFESLGTVLNSLGTVPSLGTVQKTPGTVSKRDSTEQSWNSTKKTCDSNE